MIPAMNLFEFADPTDLTAFVQHALPAASLTVPSGLSFDDQGFRRRPHRKCRSRRRHLRGPAAAVTHTAAPDIAIADFDQAGLRPPIILAVFLADISGNFLTGSSNNVDPIEGEIDVSGTLTFGRIERRGATPSGCTGIADRQTLPATTSMTPAARSIPPPRCTSRPRRDALSTTLGTA